MISLKNIYVSRLIVMVGDINEPYATRGFNDIVRTCKHVGSESYWSLAGRLWSLCCGCASVIVYTGCKSSHVYFIRLFVCLLFCFGYFVSFKNCSLTWRHYNSRWRATNFDLYSAIMAIKQWGFFSVPHLLWHRTSVYKGHLRGPVTLTPKAECLAVVTTCFNDLGLSRLVFEHPTFRLRGERSNPRRHRRASLVI